MILERLIVSLGANISDFQKGMGDAGSAINKASSKFSDVGKKMSLGITVPLLAVGTAAFAAASKVDAAMDTISIKTGATGQTLKDLGNDFNEVFTSVPATAEQVAQAIGDINARTGQAGPGLQALAAQILNVARITNSDLGATIQSSTQLFASWQIETEKQASTLDLIFRASEQTGASFTTLNDKLVQFGPQFRALGFSLSESAALLGKWEKEGISAETMLSGLTLGLRSFAKEGKDAPAALQATIESIQKAGSASDATKIAIETFGRSGVQMASAIREGRFSVDDLTKSIEGGKDTIQDAAKRTADWGEQWQVAKNKLITALQPIGVELFEALGKVMPLLTKMVDALGAVIGWFDKLTPASKTVILVFAGLLAAIGPVLTIIGTLGTAAAALGVTVGALATPIGIAVVAVGGLVAAGVAIIENWDKIKAAAVALVTRITTAAAEFLRPWTDAFRVFAYEAGRFSDAFNAGIRALTNEFAPVVSAIKSATGAIIKAFDAVLGPVLKVLGAIITGLANFVGDVGKWLGKEFVAVIKATLKPIDWIAEAFWKLFDVVVGHSIVPDLIDGIEREFNKLDRVMVQPTVAGVGNVIGAFDKFRTQVTTMEVVLSRHEQLMRKIIDVRADLALAKNAKEAATYTTQIRALEAESARYLATVNKLALDALPKVDTALAGVGKEFETKTIPLITSAGVATENLGTTMEATADKSGAMVDKIGAEFGKFQGIADAFNNIGLNLDNVFGVNVNSIISKAGNLIGGLKTVFETDWGKIAHNFITFFNDVVSTIGKFLNKVDDFLSQTTDLNNRFNMPGSGAGTVGGNIGAVTFGEWGVNLTPTNKLITQTNTLLIGQTTILASIESKLAAALTTSAPTVMQATTVPQAMTAGGAAPMVFQFGDVTIATSGDGNETYENLIAEMRRRALNSGQYTREIVNALPD